MSFRFDFPDEHLGEYSVFVAREKRFLPKHLLIVLVFFVSVFSVVTNVKHFMPPWHASKRIPLKFGIAQEIVSRINTRFSKLGF